MGGSGKSLAAEVYAIRFAAAYPGGIFWLRAFGNEVQEPHTPDERAALLENQLIGFAQALGIPTAELKPGELRKKLADALSQQGAYLWVVDDLASGVSFAEARDWLAPGTNGRTIITTRSTASSWAGTEVRIEELNDEDALNLLTHARQPQDEAEKAAARELVHELGNHALALELAAVAVQRRGFAGFRASLEDLSSRDALDFAAELFTAQGETLPHRDASNLRLSTTLLLSIRELNDAGRDFLILAAQLAAVPIERQLVVRTFARADGIEDAAAEDATDLAMSAVLGRSLARETSPGHLLVHTLVSRAIRFSAETADRPGVLRGAAVKALDGILAEIVYEGRPPATPEQVAELAAHAGAVLAGKLEKDAPMTMAEAQLIDTLYGYEIERGNYREARRITERLLAFSIEQLGEGHSNVFAYYNYLGRVLRMQGDFAGSLAADERVVDHRRSTLGAMHPDTIRIISDMGLTFYAQGDLKRARALQEQVLDLRLKVLGTQHPDTRVAMDNLAATLVTLGETAAAKELLDRTGGVPDEGLARTGDPLQGRIVRAEMLRSQHDFEGARALQEEILAERRQTLGEEHPSTLYALNNLAVTLNAQGDTRAARDMMSRVLELRTKVLGPGHLLTLTTLRNLGAICLGEGDHAKAREYLESALAKSLEVLGPEHVETLSAAHNLLMAHVRSDPSSARIGELMRNELAPLIRSDPDSLPADFREIRERILPFLKLASAASQTARGSWWRRIF
jgi:tetratricopeptide (TPR) repeat protein